MKPLVLITSMKVWLDHTLLAPKSEANRFGRGDRWILAMVGLGLTALLVTAKLLTPDENGFGTHRQLGLPPCTFTIVFGTRCPSCGMTTAWANLLDGHILASIQANAGGTILCLLACVAAPISMFLAWKGRPSRRNWFQTMVLTGLLIAMTLCMIDWLIRSLLN